MSKREGRKISPASGWAECGSLRWLPPGAGRDILSWPLSVHFRQQKKRHVYTAHWTNKPTPQHRYMAGTNERRHCFNTPSRLTWMLFRPNLGKRRGDSKARHFSNRLRFTPPTHASFTQGWFDLLLLLLFFPFVWGEKKVIHLAHLNRSSYRAEKTRLCKVHTHEHNSTHTPKIGFGHFLVKISPEPVFVILLCKKKRSRRRRAGVRPAGTFAPHFVI